MKSGVRAVLACCAIGLLAAPAAAQELSPRAYWPAPEGTRLLFVGYAYSSGDVVTDPSLPLAGVDSRLNTGLLGYLQTNSLRVTGDGEIPIQLDGELAGHLPRNFSVEGESLEICTL